MSLTRRFFRYVAAATAIAAALPPAEVVYPESTAWEVGMGEGRRAWVGGSLSRSHIAVTRSGTTYGVDITHNGSGANCTTWVPALSAATRVNVSLSSGNQTGTQVATAVAAALVSAGLSDVTSDGDTVTIPDAVVTYPDAVDTTDRTLRGMYGFQRNAPVSDGEVTNASRQGGTSATTSTHLPPMEDDPLGDFPSARNGRLLGVGFWGHGGHTPVLAAGRGPTHAEVVSGDPIEILGQADATATTGTTGTYGIALFAEPVAFSTSDELWAMIRSSSSGGPMFRQFTDAPSWRGDFSSTPENTIADTTTFSESTPFGSTYTPTIAAQYAIDMECFLLFELENGSGNYWADGAIDDWHGDQNTDIDHGTQFLAGPGLINPETTWHRNEFYGADIWPVTEYRRVWEDSAAIEDSRAGIYGFFDLNLPSTTPAELLGDLGLFGLTPSTAGSNRLFTITGLSVDIGEAARTSTYPAYGTNYVTTTGAACTVLSLPVFIAASAGSSYFTNCWGDNGRRWHDEIPTANQHAQANGVSEYRTTNTGMPHDSTSQTLPSTMVTDPTDDSPPAIAAEAVRQQRAGVRAAA